MESEYFLTLLIIYTLIYYVPLKIKFQVIVKIINNSFYLFLGYVEKICMKVKKDSVVNAVQTEKQFPNTIQQQIIRKLNLLFFSIIDMYLAFCFFCYLPKKTYNEINGF